MQTINFQDFEKVDIRAGKIVEVTDFPEARVPSYKLKVDLGNDLGVKESCAQLPFNYQAEALLGRQVLCVVNFPPKQIGPTRSEVLVLGLPDESKHAVLVQPEREIPLGARLY